MNEQFYITENGEKKGPFTFEEMKSKNVTKETLVWTEGLDSWTKAEHVALLKDILRKTPPPLPNDEPKNTTQQMPPIPESNTQPPKKKSRTGLWVSLIIIAVLLIVGGLMVVNNPNAIPGVKLEINTPKPIVVTSRADGSKSGLLKQRTTVWATVQNQGGDGNVVVTFHVYQNGNDYDRSKQIYLRANESQDLDVTFDEVKMLAGEITYHVDVNTQ